MIGLDVMGRNLSDGRHLQDLRGELPRSGPSAPHPGGSARYRQRYLGCGALSVQAIQVWRRSREHGNQVKKMIQDSVCCMEMDEKKMETESRHMEGEETRGAADIRYGIGRIEL